MLLPNAAPYVSSAFISAVFSAAFRDCSGFISSVLISLLPLKRKTVRTPEPPEILPVSIPRESAK